MQIKGFGFSHRGASVRGAYRISGYYKSDHELIQNSGLGFVVVERFAPFSKRFPEKVLDLSVQAAQVFTRPPVQLFKEFGGQPKEI